MFLFQEREKNLEMTLKNINSRKNLDDTYDDDKPMSFKRIANSLRRKVTHVFPKKESGQEANENYLNHRLYGNGRAGFDKPEYVELKIDSRQLAQLLKDNRSPSVRQRSNSCPRESWVGQLVSMASIPAQITPIYGEQSRNEELEKRYSVETLRISDDQIPSIYLSDSSRNTVNSSHQIDEGEKRNDTVFY